MGRSSADIVAALSVTVSGERARSSTLTDMSPLRDWLEDAAARDQATEALRDIAPILGATFGEWPEDGKGPAMHFDDYFGAMPLGSVLEFAAALGGPDPDVKLAQLLDGLAARPDDMESDSPGPVEAVRGRRHRRTPADTKTQIGRQQVLGSNRSVGSTLLKVDQRQRV